jgi:hypothetical protein
MKKPVIIQNACNSIMTFWRKVGFTFSIVVLGLAAHGANDLRKNLHYGAQQAVADELRIELPKHQIDAGEIKIPSLDGTQLDKTKKSTHKPLEGK